MKIYHLHVLKGQALEIFQITIFCILFCGVLISQAKQQVLDHKSHT